MEDDNTKQVSFTKWSVDELAHGSASLAAKYAAMSAAAYMSLNVVGGPMLGAYSDVLGRKCAARAPLSRRACWLAPRV